MQVARPRGILGAMTTIRSPIALLALFLAGCVSTPRDAAPDIFSAMEDLTSTLRVDGGGPDAFEAMLSEDFLRLSVMSGELMNREEFMEGIREWWDGGGRISDSQKEVLEVSSHGEFWLTRSRMRENYLPSGASYSAVTQLWAKENGRWVVRRTDVTVIEQ